MHLTLLSKVLTYTYKIALHKIVTGHLVFYIASQWKFLSSQGYQLLTNIQFVM